MSTSQRNVITLLYLPRYFISSFGDVPVHDYLTFGDRCAGERDPGLLHPDAPDERARARHATTHLRTSECCVSDTDQAAGTDRSVQRWGTIWGRALKTLKSGAGFDR